MKTTFIQQLPTLLIEKITYDLQYLFVCSCRACAVEKEDVLKSALNSRLCDLENTLDIKEYELHSNLWKEIGREYGEFEFGDVVWDTEGSCLLVMRNTNKEKSYLSIKDAESMYIQNKLQSIAIEDIIHYFGEVE